MRYDPICVQGILKALRSGIFASYAIADWAHQGDLRGIRRYGRMLRAELAAYREALRDHYAEERRWPEYPFWQRRQAPVIPLTARGESRSRPMISV